MPTIIDELVVKFNLDPSQFTEEQTKVIRRVEELLDRVRRGSKQVNDTLAGHISRFAQSFNDPIKSSIKALDDLGAQAQESGNVVEKAAGVGASGLAAFAAAGLAAYTVLKSLQGVAKEFMTTMGESAAVGRLAQMFGGPGSTGGAAGAAPGVTPWLSRVAIGAQLAAHADPNETMQNMFALSQELANLRARGDYGQRLQSLALARIHTGTQANPESIENILKQVFEKAPGMDAARAQALLGPVFGRQFTQYAQQGPQNRDRYEAIANDISLTDAQKDAAIREQQALDRLSSTWQSFVRILETHAAPGLTQIINRFAAWLLELQKNPEALRRIQSTLDGLGRFFNTFVTDALNPTIAEFEHLLRVWDKIAAIFDKIKGIIFPKQQTPEEEKQSEEDEKRFQESTKDLPWYQRAWENLKRPFRNWGEESGPAPGEPGGPVPGHRRGYFGPAVDTSQPLPEGTVRGSWFGNSPGWVDEKDSGLQASGVPVAGHPGIALPSRRTLGQWFDVTAPNGQTLRLKQTDTGPSQDPSRTGGVHRGIDINSPAAELFGYTAKTFPTNAPFTYKPAPPPSPTPAVPSPNLNIVNQYNTGLDSVRANQAGAVTNNNSTASTTHNYDNDINAPVTVNMGGQGNPYMVGGAVSEALKRQVLASSANTGLE